jgi:hypothetical protein
MNPPAPYDHLGGASMHQKYARVHPVSQGGALRRFREWLH